VNAARAILLAGLAAAVLAAPACGKKGPPLAPLARVPGRASDIAARRTGDVVTITFTVPSANLDDTKPADIARVDVFGYTAMAQNDVRDTRRMTLAASVPVRKPPEPDEGKPDADRKKAGGQKPAKQKPAKQTPGPAPPPEPGVDQGALVSVTETLTAAMQVALAPDVKRPAATPVWPASLFDTPRVAPLAGPTPVAEPRRFYVAYGMSRGGNRGGASPRPAVPLTAPPAAPLQPTLTATEGGVVVSWAVPPGARLPYQDPAEGDLLKATSRGLESAPPLAYVVYLVPRPGQTDGKTAATPATPATGTTRLTEKPVTARTWTDTASEFGVERCYDVRAVRVQGNVSIESAPSPAACITPADTFPPPAPKSLAAVAGDGAVSLIWESIGAPDVAGYLVLRGAAPDGALKPLFEAPMRETTYRDATAKPGVRYVYAVVAVDRAIPPNRSPLSNKVEETAR
jgi:hypothetical protein